MRAPLTGTVALTLACCLAIVAALPRNEIDEGWILLHDGESNAGWTAESGSGWSAAGGALVMDGSGSGYIRTNAAFVDFLLRFDLRSAQNGKASLVVRAARDGNPKETGYEIPLGTGAGDPPSGSVAGHAKAPPGGPAAGQWTPFEIECSGGSLVVRSGGRTLASASGLAGQAGLIQLQSNRGGKVEFRNLRLKPLTPQSLFNGSDLSGWKSTGTQPKPGGKKLGIIPLGKGKAKEVKWAVSGGAIHGEGGPGQLESVNAYDNLVFQSAVRVNSKKKRLSLLLRGDAGGLGSGYEISLTPGSAGAVTGLGGGARGMGTEKQYMMVTVAAFERRLLVWIDGSLVADVADSRTEGANPKKEARITPGMMAFYSPDEDANLDIRSARVITVPKVLGHTKNSAPVTATATPPPAAIPAAPAPAAPTPANPGASAAEKALKEQFEEQKRSKAQEDAKKQQVAGLMGQALTAKSPEQQVEIFDRILVLDPDNLPAFNGRKDAQAKIDADRAKSAQEQQNQQKQQAEQAQKQQTYDDAMSKATAAFAAGNVAGADQALSIAERAMPGDPRAAALRQRLDAAKNRWNSVLVLGGAGLGAAFLTMAGWFALSRRKKDPYLEITQGLDKGKRFNIDQEVLSLGAIAEDGGAKNDVVLRDAERMVSRFHAQILNKDGRLFVVDLGSSNGTMLDKKRIPARQPQPLKNGSRVVFGGTCGIRIGYEKRAKDKSR